METKNPMLSKTLWANFLMAGFALFFPPAKEWMAMNTEITAMVFTGVNFLLRMVTKEKLSLGA